MNIKQRPNCTIPGCDRPHAGKGMCRMHYYRMRRNGTLTLKYRHDGEGTINQRGYVMMNVAGQRKPEHVLIAEAALGHSLPSKAVVHHHNQNPSDNRPGNLVICPDASYHQLLHKRMRAIAACGNPDWRPCVFCKQYDSLSNLVSHGIKGSFTHVICHRKAALDYYYLTKRQK